MEERLLYYADFYDLKTNLDKHWEGEFSVALSKKSTFNVLLEELENLRNPDAHRRELLPHQKALAVGIAGEIRTRLIRYRSKMETAAGCFPRIETVRDSVGNLYLPNKTGRSTVNLRPGDSIDFVVTASDPLGEPLLYGMSLQPSHHGPSSWQKLNSFRWDVVAVGAPFGVYFWIKTGREHHAHDGYDDMLMSAYDVLPPKS